jgi:phospholipase/carboxylesterase
MLAQPVCPECLQPHDLNQFHLTAAPVFASVPGSKPAPCLVFLHGAGASPLVPGAASLPAGLLAIGLRAPIPLKSPDYGWYRYARANDLTPDDATFRASLAAVSHTLLALHTSPGIDASRIYLHGTSQGAVMAAAAALLSPALISGIIFMSGYWPFPESAAAPNALRGLPFFVAHGRQDTTVPVDMGRAAAEAIRGLGGAVEYVETDEPHGDVAMSKAQAWLRDRLNGPLASA